MQQRAARSRVRSALLTRSPEKRPDNSELAVKLLSRQMQGTSLSNAPAAACSELAEEPVVRAQTADSATARQPAGRAPVGATLDGGNWVLSDGKHHRKLKRAEDAMAQDYSI